MQAYSRILHGCRATYLTPNSFVNSPFFGSGAAGCDALISCSYVLLPFRWTRAWMTLRLNSLATWATKASSISAPRMSDQDTLDAAICAFIVAFAPWSSKSLAVIA
jgi:hypothetical protein